MAADERKSSRKAPLASRVVAGLHKRSAEIWRQTFKLLRRESAIDLLQARFWTASGSVEARREMIHLA